MSKQLKAIRGAGAQLVVLAPEIADKAKETAAKNELPFVVLQDANNSVARQYGLVFKLADSIIPVYRDFLKLHEANGNDSMELPLTATYVIDQQGVIQYAFLDANYTQRADPLEVVAAVKKVAAAGGSTTKTQ